jgi:16S rRNA (guanine1516-N2)-methyltransferase
MQANPINKTNSPLISITYSHPSSQAKARAFSEESHLGCDNLNKCHSQLALNYSDLLVELIDIENNIHLSVDFIEGSLGHRKKHGGGRGQTIAKAIGLKQGKPVPSVLDATAGLAKDSYVFACLGCPVVMLERSPIVAELVKDGIARASLCDEFDDILKQGFKLYVNDALSHINSISDEDKPDVIYLDPMYPDKKKSASVKKNMQLLQKLLGHDLDTDDVLNAALKKAGKRVVVKRPKGAPILNGSSKPTLAYESKGTRYDTYIIS